VALATLLSCGLHGCTNVSGGAVELSWSLEDADGTHLDCPAEVARIRLWWQGDQGLHGSSWPCKDNRGVTGFEIPTGANQLWVTPECPDSSTPSAATFVSPPPIVRTFAEGDVVELHAIVMQLVVPSATVNCAATACVCRAP
jgi:hypothetical protein